MVVMIELAFFAAGEAGGYQAGHRGAFGVGDDEDMTIDLAESIQSDFGGVAGVFEGEGMRIGEDGSGVRKGDSVFGSVCFRLGLVSLELHNENARMFS